MVKDSSHLQDRPLSLMSDRRVVRGNTYSGTIAPSRTSRTSLSIQRTVNKQPPSARLSQLGRNPLRGARSGTGKMSVPPVFGRRHQELQTEHWLEEIGDKREEKEMATQVNLSEEEGGTAAGKKRIEMTKVNVEDKETQIYQNDPNLFVFDEEVRTQASYYWPDSRNSLIRWRLC